MAIHPTNDFNKISLIPVGQMTVAQQNILMTMALNGDSIVNPFSDVLDAAGLTPEGRARKEREEEEHFRETMAQLEERRLEFQRELDRMDQACDEALRENEEQLLKAREDLKKIHDNAYQIHMPDGSLVRVYRDGNKVRTEEGVEVGREIIRADDIPASLATWDQRKAQGDVVERLQAEHRKILEYKERLGEARNASNDGSMSSEEINKLKKGLDQMPDSVRTHAAQLDDQPEAMKPHDQTARGTSTDERATAMEAFAEASSDFSANAPDDYKPVRKTEVVSAPAPR